MVLIPHISKTKYEKDGSDFEDKINKVDRKIPDVSGLVKKTNFNVKITEVEGKIPSITRLATSSALTAVEDKVPNVSSLVKKPDFTAKGTEIGGKIPSITGLASSSALTAVEDKIPDVSSLVTKTDFDARLPGLNKKITSNKTKHLLVENELKKIEKFDAAYFRGKNYFEEDGMQNYLVFQPVYKYFEKNRR